MPDCHPVRVHSSMLLAALLLGGCGAMPVVSDRGQSVAAPTAGCSELEEFHARIVSIGSDSPEAGGHSIQEACRSAASAIEARCSGGERASLLEALGDRCYEELPWTDQALLEVAQAALKARRLCRAADPAAHVRDLQRLAHLHHCRAETQTARTLYEAAVEAARQDLGPTSEELASTLNSMAWILTEDRAHAEQALAAADLSLSIRRMSVPVKIDKMVLSLNTRAAVLYVDKRLEEAIATWHEALAQADELPEGKERLLQQARIRNNLGEAYLQRGNFGVASRFLGQARDLYTIAGPEGGPARQLASTLLNLADYFYAVGDYPAALGAYEEALEGHRKWIGDDPDRQAGTLSNFALVLEESGLWEAAADRLREALDLRLPDVARPPPSGVSRRLQLLRARDLARLGDLEVRMGKPSGRPRLEEALAIQRQILGELADPDHASTLLALARTEIGKERSLAQGHLDQAAAILRELNPRHPMLVEAYRLGALAQAKPERGLGLAEEGLELASEIYGPDSPKVAELRFTKASLLAACKTPAAALREAMEAYSTSIDHMAQVIQAFPEDQALAFAADRRRNLDLAFTLLAREGELEPMAVVRVWEGLARSRSIVLDALLSRQRLARAGSDVRIGRFAQHLVAARSRFARLLVQSYRNPEFQSLQSQAIRKARQEVEEAEESLARESVSQLTKPPAEAVPLGRVQAALPPRTTLLSTVRYHDLDRGEAAYLAVVVPPSPSPPGVVPLGSARILDESVAAWRRCLLAEQRNEGHPGPDCLAASSREAGQEVRRQAWDPVARHLPSPGIVLIVPDGAFNLVNFAALPTAEGYLLDEGWIFHGMTTERTLLSPPATESRSGGLLLVGGIDYQAAEPEGSAFRQDASDTANPCVPLRPRFGPLPASLEEVRRIDSLWRSRTLAGADPPPTTTLVRRRATEGHFRQLARGRQVIHIATHGFASARSCEPAPAGARGLGSLTLSSAPADEDPIWISGLVFAGANLPNPSAEDDGFLLAEEVADLDLRGVEWVVLSACETGLGQVEPGEGVRGLARAFQIAGVRTLVLSLWPVEDKTALSWMEELYSGRLHGKMTTADAAAAASRAVLQRRRQDGESTSPSYWGAFVTVGDWR